MKTLNQLLSRVKSIFGLKATPATATTPNAEPPTDLSVVSNPRISVAFAAIEKYLAENYSTPTDNLSYQDYANGASFFSKDAIFAPSLVILTDSDGLYNLPDNVMMLVSVTSTKDENWLIEELGKFILTSSVVPLQQWLSTKVCPSNRCSDYLVMYALTQHCTMPL
jgi:hypothetical protein